MGIQDLVSPSAADVSVVLEGSAAVPVVRAVRGGGVIPVPSLNAAKILDSLRCVSWPECYSRKNVMPEGMNYIQAFSPGLG